MVMQYVAAGAAVVGAVSSIVGGNKAKKAAKEAGKANARLIQAETAEQLRRTRLQFDKQIGTTRAFIGASGVQLNVGTPQRYVDFMKKEQRAQLDWTEKAGKMRASAAKKQGSYVGGQAFNQGLAGGLAGISSAAGYLMNA